MARVLRKRLDFGKVPSFLEIPNLIEIQKKSYDRFLQAYLPAGKRQETGLQAAFLSVFPIMDYNETASIEFLEYIVGNPKYSLRECLDKGVNYSSPLKIKVMLNLWEKGEDGKKRLKESRSPNKVSVSTVKLSFIGKILMAGTITGLGGTHLLAF